MRFALLAGAFAHLVEPVVHQVELEVVLVDVLGREAEHAHLAEQKRHAAAVGEIAAVLAEDVAQAAHGTRGVVRGGVHQQRNAMGRVAFVDNFLVVHRFLAGGAADGRLHLVLRHVEGAGVLDAAAQGGVAIGVVATGADGNADVLGDAGELLRHAVPPREHRMLADFKNTTHENTRKMTGCGYGSSARRLPSGSGALPTGRGRLWPTVT